MADYRKPGAFTMIGGFNITNNDPVDSRAYVTDINHIYEPDNWVSVKPYPGLIVSAPDGQVRICVNSDYTLTSSWKEISGSNGTTPVTDYNAALELASTGEVEIGQLVYALDPVTNGETTYSSGLYVVTAVGETAALSKIGTTSASGNVEDDVRELQTNVSTITNNVNTINAKVDTIGTKVDTIGTKVDTIEEGAQVNKIESIKVNGVNVDPDSNKAVNIEIPEVVYDTIEDNGENIIANTTATAPSTNSLLVVLNNLRNNISKIPQFRIEIVNEANEDGTPKVTESISLTTIYLVKTNNSSSQLYTEWIYIEDKDAVEGTYKWEKLGDASIDLTQYAKTEDVNNAISQIQTTIDGLATKAELAQTIADYATKTELNALTEQVNTLVNNSITTIQLNGENVAVTSNTANIIIESIPTDIIDGLLSNK